MALPIMIDCDPGHDDAIALVLALASPELEVKAVTASAGNQTPEKTLRNVLRMLTLLNRPDIPVAGGAWKPLMRDLIIADNVHGESGLDGPSLPEPAFAPQNCTAVELMASVLRESQEPVTLVVRPEGISLMGLEETVPEGTALRGTIENYSFLGRMIRYWVRVGEEVFVIDDANVDLTGARTGDVQLRLDTRKLHVLKGGGADAAG
jgi:hypothetical protein